MPALWSISGPYRAWVILKRVVWVVYVPKINRGSGSEVGMAEVGPTAGIGTNACTRSQMWEEGEVGMCGMFVDCRCMNDDEDRDHQVVMSE